jgi:hypothetical protein
LTRENHGAVRDLVKFFRANPQALVLLIVCVVLGFGTLLVVAIDLLNSRSGTPTGDPSEAAITLFRALGL